MISVLSDVAAFLGNLAFILRLGICASIVPSTDVVHELGIFHGCVATRLVVVHTWTSSVVNVCCCCVRAGSAPSITVVVHGLSIIHGCVATRLVVVHI